MTAPRSSFAHLALCVADLEKQARFYCNVLGFEAATPYDASGTKVAAFMDVTARSFRGQFLRRADFHLELLQYEPTQPGRSRTADDVGIAHLSFVVDNIAEVGERVLAEGGRMLTRMDHAFGATIVRFAFCTDPDGNRIELVEYVEDADPAPHAGFLGMSDFGWPPTLT
jgi:catechol 2,3-dioxygenase-like lactoylglutathione lyase family enzyme